MNEIAEWILQILDDGEACTLEIHEEIQPEASVQKVNGHISELRHLGLVTGQRRNGLMILRLTPAGRECCRGIYGGSRGTSASEIPRKGSETYGEQ